MIAGGRFLIAQFHQVTGLLVILRQHVDDTLEVFQKVCSE